MQKNGQEFFIAPEAGLTGGWEKYESPLTLI